MKHTPGPWGFRAFNKFPKTTVTDHGDSMAIECYGLARARDGNEVAEANARLIAAAPELLEALKEVVRISDRKHIAWDKARAAIAKAEGGPQ